MLMKWSNIFFEEFFELSNGHFIIDNSAELENVW